MAENEQATEDAVAQEQPDALLDKWLEDIRDAERRAERVTAGIRLR